MAKNIITKVVCLMESICNHQNKNIKRITAQSVLRLNNENQRLYFNFSSILDKLTDKVNSAIDNFTKSVKSMKMQQLTGSQQKLIPSEKTWKEAIKQNNLSNTSTSTVGSRSVEINSNTVHDASKIQNNNLDSIKQSVEVHLENAHQTVKKDSIHHNYVNSEKLSKVDNSLKMQELNKMNFAQSKFMPLKEKTDSKILPCKETVNNYIYVDDVYDKEGHVSNIVHSENVNDHLLEQGAESRIDILSSNEMLKLAKQDILASKEEHSDKPLSSETNHQIENMLVENETSVNENDASIKQFIAGIVQNHPKLEKMDINDIYTNYETLLQHGITESNIKENFWLLEHKNDDLKTKLLIISKFGLDMSLGIPFVNLDKSQMQVFEQACQTEGITPGEKIKMLSQVLKITDKEMCTHFYKKGYLRKEKSSLLKANFELLLDNGFKLEDILRNCKIVGYQTQLLKLKLDLIQKNNVKSKTLSMLCKSMNQLKKESTETVAKTQQLQKEPLIVDYIIGRIKCDKDVITNAISENPKLINMEIDKVKQVIDIFGEFNIDLNLLMNKPKLFNKRTDVLGSRLKKMKKMECDIPNKLHYLMMPSKEFEDAMKKSRPL